MLGAMAKYLGVRGIRLFDYPRWSEAFRDELRTHGEGLAQAAGLPIESIRRVKAFRKGKASRTSSPPGVSTPA